MVKALQNHTAESTKRGLQAEENEAQTHRNGQHHKSKCENGVLKGKGVKHIYLKNQFPDLLLSTSAVF